MAVFVLAALTRRQWVREEDLAKALKLHLKQLRHTLQFFEEEKLVTRYHRREEQLKPLALQLARVKDLQVPEFGSLQAWEARASAAARANADSYANDSFKSSQGQGYVGTPMPFLGETRVEVALSGAEVKEEDTGADIKTTSLKVLPPGMIKQGMSLTKEQRGEVKP